MRDPRDVVVSEHRMRRKTFLQDVPDLDTFIWMRFEVGALSASHAVGVSKQSYAIEIKNQEQTTQL